MTGAFKPYPAYKPSGVEWLGDVPAHWEVRRVKQLFRRIVGGSTPSSNERRFWDGPHVWVTPADVGKSTYIHGSQRRLTQEGLDNCSAELLPIGSIVVTTRAPVGNVALARVPFCTNQGCKALTPCEREIDSSFAFFLLGVLQTELRSLANGTTFTEISGNKLGGVRLPVPPLPEQTAIVRFLDRADQRIRRYLRAREKLIALLEEQKQAVVHETVTGRIDVRTGQPYPAYKPSGVEWLGEVPAHWEVQRLKHWVGINERTLPETTDPDFEFLYLEIGAVGIGALTEEPDLVRFESAPSRARRLVEYGDTIVSTVRTYLKAVLFVGETNDNIICSTGFAVMTPRRETASKFVSYLAQSNTFTDRLTAESVGIAYPAIAEGRFGSFHVSLPSLAEQIVIVAYLDRAATKIDTAITRANREIELLREYRTRLIADVVTGKLDVREAAAALPEVAPLAADDDAGDVPDAGDAPSLDRETRPAMAAG